MARKKAPEKRATLPDPVFGSELVARFISAVMQNGKKALAEKIVYGAFERMFVLSKGTKKKEEEGDEGESGRSTTAVGRNLLRAKREKVLELFNKAIENVQPMVEVRPRRVGGATYQIPVEVLPGRRMALAMRWLIESAADRGGRSMSYRLGDELLDAIHHRGGAVKRRENVHATANANKAFAHFRWS